MSTLTSALAVAAALGAGLMGGFFFAFSNTVMPSLGRLPADGAVAAMQGINVVVLNPLFFMAFFGSAALCLVLGVIALVNPASPGTWWLLAGSLLYLIGVIGVTMAFNVPMNEALAAVSADSTAAAALWEDYLTRWTMWNHVRAIAGLVASGLFVVALLRAV
ncbi:anthrone oxygenase family protein [Aquamicrobium sp. LC103]|uniref:anthrone oxygenase family protein n=1 Tax=Aquamicrobium sp. LC103 TaxID=1120658 RepID=UPI00063E95F3|nr:anthrone oxygenase family protein [Aquamicrobium sp. LC103]TKT74275.1 DUF1772 domain-containing protein [Aquamicrobium sp. LC103]